MGPCVLEGTFINCITMLVHSALHVLSALLFKLPRFSVKEDAKR